MVLRDQKKRVQLDKGQGLREVALELLQVDTAQENAQELRAHRGTAPELLVRGDIVQVSQDQEGSLQVLTEVLGIVLVLQDRKETGTALVPLGQIHHQSHPELRVGWELLGLNQAILGLWEEEGCWLGQLG